jgi:hypothetical protein
VRLGVRSTQRLTYQLRLSLEPECFENPTAIAREIPGMERKRSETLKLFVVSDVEKLNRAQSAAHKWTTAKTPGNWKEWVSAQTDISVRWLSRAVNRGELREPR